MLRVSPEQPDLEEPEKVTRETEQAKYEQCYALETYRMGGNRYNVVMRDLELIPTGATYLDVGCGRGETLSFTRPRGVEAWGIELVPALCGEHVLNGVVTALPFEDGGMEYVSCYDMLEHLPEEQVDPALDELFRVCSRVLFLTTNQKRSHLGDLELHLTRKPREWWEAKILARVPENSQIERSRYGNDEWHWRITFP